MPRPTATLVQPLMRGGESASGRPDELSTFLDAPTLSSYLDRVDEVDELIAEGVSSPDPAVGLRAVRALQRLQERLEAIHVANAREQGWSWQAIAEALEVSRQAVHQKHNRKG